MNAWRNILSVLWIAALLAGCDSGSSSAGKSTAHTQPPRPIELDASTKTGPELFKLHCISCHGEQGAGVPGIFPPLTNSPRLLSAKNFVHGLIHGYPPPSDPNGSPWMGEMPKFSHLSDEQLATLATYVRQEWSGAQDAVTVELVAEQRASP